MGRSRGERLPRPAASLRDELGHLEQLPDERRILAAVRLAQDIPRAWSAATPEKRRELAWAVFERITVKDAKVIAVKPREDLAPLLALRVHTCGPDRGQPRSFALPGGVTDRR